MNSKRRVEMEMLKTTDKGKQEQMTINIKEVRYKEKAIIKLKKSV